jgi:ATP dependent DNA ligase domain
MIDERATAERVAVDLARPLRPQEYGSVPTRRIVDPIVEPQWSGVRVIAAVQVGEAALFRGEEPLEERPEVNEALVAMVGRTADGAILDGYLTKQVTADDAPGTITVDSATPSTGDFLTQSLLGTRRSRSMEAAQALEAEQKAREFAPDDVVRFVATDLLWLDGTWLLEVPLLERRRLLEAIVPGEDLIRSGPYVRPPIETWIGSWRAQGFTGMTFKEANSRYRPGEKSDDWTTTPMPRR